MPHDWPSQKSLLETLLLFNEKADDIRKYAFDQPGLIQESRDFPLHIPGKTNPQVGIINENYLKGLILDFRFFFQRECKLETIATAYERLDIHPDYKKTFSLIKQTIDSYFAENAPLPEFIEDTKQFTRQQVVEVFFYSKYAHQNTQHQAILDHWDSHPLIMGHYQTVFIQILYFFAGIIQIIRQINMAVIETYDTKEFRVRDFKNVISNLNLDNVYKIANSPFKEKK